MTGYQDLFRSQKFAFAGKILLVLEEEGKRKQKDRILKRGSEGGTRTTSAAGKAIMLALALILRGIIIDDWEY